MPQVQPSLENEIGENNRDLPPGTFPDPKPPSMLKRRVRRGDGRLNSLVFVRRLAAGWLFRAEVRVRFFRDQAIGHNFPDIVLNHFRCLNRDNAE
jgi:hypothetical protein